MTLDSENQSEKLNLEDNGAETLNIDFEDDEIDSLEELEQKKQEVNEFSAENNSAQNQIFIQDMGTGGFTVNYYSQKMEPIVPKLPVKKRYDLRELEECIEFVETFKNSEYFTIAVILCIFETVVLTDLSDMKLKLLSCLPKETVYDVEGKEINTLKESTYIALNSILAVIGAKKIVAQNGQICVGLGENSVQALVNMLEQFPDMQTSVIEFLIKLTQEEKYHVVLYEYHIATVLAGIYSFKMMDIKERILSELYINPANEYILGVFVYRLYKESAEDAKIILSQWFGDKTWLWRAVCLVYVLFRENNIFFPYEKELKGILAKKVSYYRKNDFDFISELLMQSKHFRTIICSAFSHLYKRTGTRTKQRILAQSYLYLVRKSYYKVNSKIIELPLVACDTKQQQEFLTDILEKIMTEYRLRKQIYAILQAYLKEVSQYEFSEKVIRHIAAFCYNLSSADEEYREDLKDVLQKCHSRAAKQVFDLI